MTDITLVLSCYSCRITLNQPALEAQATHPTSSPIRGALVMRGYGVSMSSEWKRFEGQVLLNHFHLRKLLGNTSYSAVFLTQSPPPESKNIAVKLITPGAKADSQLSLLQRAAKLSHPNLLHLLPGGRSKLADMDSEISARPKRDST